MSVFVPPAWRSLLLTGEDGAGRVRGMPRLLLHLEGAALFVAATAAWFVQGGSLTRFLLLLPLPDLLMLGYLAGGRVGALAYNAGHTTVVPLTLLLVLLVRDGLAPDPSGLAMACLPWLAHIGFDRLCGFGLKYSGGFRHTHLS